MRLFVQPVSKRSTVHSGGKGLLQYQLSRWILPATTKYGGITSPSDRTAWIAVTHSRLPGWIFFAFPRPSDEVTTRVGEIWPIKNPVSSKFQISDSRIPCFATVLRKRSNYVRIIFGSSHLALW